VALLILIVVVAFLAYRAASPDERERLVAATKTALTDIKTVATTRRPDDERFWQALRERMPRVLVTPVLAISLTAVFGAALVAPGAISAPETLLSWGASLGTRTTNGEWWRLLTAAFVHTSTLHLLIDLVVLMQLGVILERLVGRLTFVATYVSAGLFTALASVSMRPVAITAGSSGAIFGLYGLLAAALVWQTFRRWRKQPDPQVSESDAVAIVIPTRIVRRLAIGGLLFLAYSALSGHAHTAEFVGLLIGMMCGAWLARCAQEKTARSRDVGYAALAIAIVALVGAIRIGHITDVKPELVRVLALEKTTAGVYQAELDAMKKGRMPAQAVARLAEETIVFELQEADARLAALPNVPPEHQQVVADAREYLRLRTDSWRARGVVIRRTYAAPPQKPDDADDTTWRRQLQTRFIADNAARGHADSAERDSLQALQRIASFLAGPPGLKTGPTS